MDALFDGVHAFGTELVVSLAAVASPVPHTHPVIVWGSANTPELADKHNMHPHLLRGTDRHRRRLPRLLPPQEPRRHQPLGQRPPLPRRRHQPRRLPRPARAPARAPRPPPPPRFPPQRDHPLPRAGRPRHRPRRRPRFLRHPPRILHQPPPPPQRATGATPPRAPPPAATIIEGPRGTSCAAPSRTTPPPAKATPAVVDLPNDADRMEASEKSLTKMTKFVRSYAAKSGTSLHPQPEITEFLVIGPRQARRRTRPPPLPLQLLRRQARRGQILHLDLPLRRDAEVEVLPLTALLRSGRSSDHRAPPPRPRRPRDLRPHQRPHPGPGPRHRQAPGEDRAHHRQEESQRRRLRPTQRHKLTS